MKKFEAHHPPIFRPKRTPFVYCPETIQGWTRVEFPDMSREVWEEAKAWIAEQGMVHRVHGHPTPISIKQLSQPISIAAAHKAVMIARITESLKLMAGVVDEPFAISFKDENEALLFKMRWVG